jgi:hypothetical protein
VTHKAWIAMTTEEKLEALYKDLALLFRELNSANSKITELEKGSVEPSARSKKLKKKA